MVTGHQLCVEGVRASADNFPFLGQENPCTDGQPPYPNVDGQGNFCGGFLFILF